MGTACQRIRTMGLASFGMRLVRDGCRISTRRPLLGEPKELYIVFDMECCGKLSILQTKKVTVSILTSIASGALASREDRNPKRYLYIFHFFDYCSIWVNYNLTLIHNTQSAYCLRMRLRQSKETQ